MSLEAKVYNKNKILSVNIDNCNYITSSILEDVSNRIKAGTELLNKALKVTLDVIYNTEEVKYLHVRPEEVQWISPNYSITYKVESNTNWTIE